MKRTLFDPGTLLMATQVGGGVLEGMNSIAQGRAEAAELASQARTERIQNARDMRDYKMESQREMSRMMAVLAANGASESAASLATSAAGEYGIGRVRLREDSKSRVRSLMQGASYAKAQGLYKGIGIMGDSLVSTATKRRAMEDEAAGSG